MPNTISETFAMTEETENAPCYFSKNIVTTRVDWFTAWGFALRASDFALRATTGQVDPTSKGSRLERGALPVC